MTRQTTETTIEMQRRVFLGSLPAPYTRKSDVLIGIPVLNRMDLLVKAISSLDVASDVLVINNNINSKWTQELHELSRQLEFTVVHQSRNVGVSASWNTVARYAFSNGYRWACIVGNDTEHSPGAIKEAIDIAENSADRETDAVLWRLNSYNSFLISSRTIAEVGWFDENFYPAYCEDCDFDHRIRIAQKQSIDVFAGQAERVLHHGSQTIRSDSGYSQCNEYTHFNWNMNHFRLKWGCELGGFAFHSPYNDPRWDWRYWPDPGGSIDHRDWNKILGRDSVSPE